MLSIISYEGHSTQSDTTTCQSVCLKLKCPNIPSVSENMQCLELSYKADGSVKLYNYFGKIF